jgi:hypothetical protein
LYEQRLIVFQATQRTHNGVKGRPRPGGTSRSSIDNKVVGPLGNIGIKIIHEHAQSGLLLPPFA